MNVPLAVIADGQGQVRFFRAGHARYGPAEYRDRMIWHLRALLPGKREL